MFHRRASRRRSSAVCGAPLSPTNVLFSSVINTYLPLLLYSSLLCFFLISAFVSTQNCFFSVFHTFPCQIQTLAIFLHPNLLIFFFWRISEKRNGPECTETGLKDFNARNYLVRRRCCCTSSLFFLHFVLRFSLCRFVFFFLGGGASTYWKGDEISGKSMIYVLFTSSKGTSTFCFAFRFCFNAYV